MSEQKEKLKALQQTIERLEKSYGKGVVMKMALELDSQIKDLPCLEMQNYL